MSYCICDISKLAKAKKRITYSSQLIIQEQSADLLLPGLRFVIGGTMARPVKRGNVTFQLNMAGLNELMKSDAMKEVLQEAGEFVANSASSMTDGEPYGVNVHDAQWVSIANVYGDSEVAKRRNYEENILLKALGSSGLPNRK